MVLSASDRIHGVQDASGPAAPLEQLESWGMVLAARAHVYRPADLEALHACCEAAARDGFSVAARGAGCSYSDAALNDRNIIVDFSRMNRILGWKAESGVLTVEPGVTLRQIWQAVIADGYWPPVVTGTMETTAGGCAAFNVHGKNQFRIGSFGDHVIDFDLLLASGDIIRCSRDRNREIFLAALGGMGLLGCFVQLRLQMMKVPSGFLDVDVMTTGNLSGMFAEFEGEADSDYVVGWVDCHARGDKLGRGVIHRGRAVAAGDPVRGLCLEAQTLTQTWLRLPWSVLMNRLGVARVRGGIRLVNALKYHATRIAHAGSTLRRSLADFSFLLDTIPDWKKAFHGLYQYQSLIPRGRALDVFQRMLAMSQRAGIIPCLAVIKRHRPDPFLLSYTLDGYSLAMEFPVEPGRLDDLRRLAVRMDELVREAAGRIYLAKNHSIDSARDAALFSPEGLERFRRVKRDLDPGSLFESDLSRRLFGKRLERI